MENVEKITIEITVEQAFMILSAFSYMDQNARISSDPPDEEEDALRILIVDGIMKIGQWD